MIKADAFVVEMIRRASEMRAADLALKPKRPPPLKRGHAWIRDMEMFEGAMDALLQSDLHPENGFVPEAAPGFAALLVRVAEQTAAEFGPKAAALAFRRLGEEMEDG